MNPPNPWQQVYHAALVETDPAKLHERIEQAANAIQEAMAIAQLNSDRDEQRRLEDALLKLHLLRREIPPSRRPV